jgi:uncharacterized protein (TIGR02246 family)
MTGAMQETCTRSDDETAIRKLVDTWLAASQAGDIATVLGLMTDDVVFMVPGREPFGKAAFAAASDAMKNVRMEGKSDIQELRVLGDWAYLRNYIEMTVTPESGQPVKRSGYTLTILRKESGQWRVAHDANLLT